MDKIIYYSDHFIITENEKGFIFNFLKAVSDIEGEVDYGFRIGMSPFAAKEFFVGLYKSLGGHELKNGEIKIEASKITKIKAETPPPFGF